MALATGNVLLRIVGVPFRGAYELVSFLGAVVTAFCIGLHPEAKFNIVVDILSDTFPGGVKRILDGSAISLPCCSLASFHGGSPLGAEDCGFRGSLGDLEDRLLPFHFLCRYRLCRPLPDPPGRLARHIPREGREVNS